jgi:outer membrane protein assembly factor BamB
MSPLRHAVAASLTTLALGVTVQAGNWPQFRGPHGQGVSDEAALPSTWSPATNVAWKTAIAGLGHSSPIVWGNHVFVTTAIEGEPLPGAKAPVHMLQEDPAKPASEFVHPDSLGHDRKHTYKVIALALDTGAVRWEKVAYEGPVFDGRHKRSSYASPTPVTDGTRVFAYFGSEGVYAYDFAGKLLWKVDVGDIKTLGMGTASSPVLFKNLVILQCDEDGGEASFITALDSRTGKTVWKTKRPTSVTWTTPALVAAGATEELVTAGNEFIIGYDPATGAELWRAKGLESNTIATPLVGHGLVIVSAGYPTKKVIAIRPGGKGDVSGSDRIAWTYDKGTAYVPSPILYGDYVYLITDAGLLTCLDAKTGAVKYEGGRPPVPAKFVASPVAFGGNLYLTSTDGDTFVVKAGPTHEVVRTNELDEPVYASLAPAQGRLLIRGQSHLYCIKPV